MAEQLVTERRAETRRRVFKGGLISYRGGTVSCTVRNLSGRGAALDVGYPVNVPPTFRLAIAADDVIVPCRLIWSVGTRFGVAFD